MIATPLTLPPRRFEALDSLRGVCAVLVVLFHTPIASHWRDWPLIQHAYLFVDYFFVLSGFVIAHAYSGRLTTVREGARFMIRRLGRVWPLHVLMLTAFIGLELVRLWFPFDAVTPFARDRSIGSIFTNLFLLQAWNLHPWLTWNGPAWTLSAELACYAIFAGLVLILPRRFRVIGSVLAIACGGTIVAWAPHGMNSTHDFAVPRAVYGFFVGCLLQGVWTRIPRQSGRAATTLEVLTVIATCVFIAWAQGTVAVMASLVFLGAIWVFAGEDGAVSRLLDCPVFVTLGRWSFSIYMVHMFVLTVLLIVARSQHWMPNGRRIDFGSVWINDLVALGVFGLILLLALSAHRLIETPAQRMIDRWTAKPKHGGG
jgi:peptidoglycan/LPS O-acetylase OafA/YrhL